MPRPKTSSMRRQRRSIPSRITSIMSPVPGRIPAFDDANRDVFNPSSIHRENGTPKHTVSQIASRRLSPGVTSGPCARLPVVLRQPAARQLPTPSGLGASNGIIITLKVPGKGAKSPGMTPDAPGIRAKKPGMISKLPGMDPKSTGHGSQIELCPAPCPDVP